MSAARAAIDALQPYVIRHCIDDFSPAERMHFGAVMAQCRCWRLDANDG